MEVFTAIAVDWETQVIIGTFATEADAQAAIEEVQTWTEETDSGDASWLVYGGYDFTILRTTLGEIEVTHPDVG